MSYNCPEKLAELYDAIHELIAKPAQVVKIRHKEREVQYTAANLDAMMNLYRVHWNNCGAEAGLPPLDATAAVRRGRPVRGRFYG